MSKIKQSQRATKAAVNEELVSLRREKHTEDSLHTLTSLHVPHSSLWAKGQFCGLGDQTCSQWLTAYSNLPGEKQMLVSRVKKVHYPCRAKIPRKGKDRKMSTRLHKYLPRGWKLNVFLHSSPPYSLRQGLSADSRAHLKDWVSQPINLLQRPSSTF